MTKFTEKSQQILELINKSSNILLSLHAGPDGDSVGSCLSMYHVLTSMNKCVTLISGDSDLPQYLSSLPGFSNITVSNIANISIERYDLMIILDTPSFSQLSRQSKVEFPKNMRTIMIDHHMVSDIDVDIKLVQKKAPATCQILYNLYKNWGINISPEIAICLYIGMFTDTGGFKYQSTTYKTYQIAAKLTKIYPEFSKIVFNIENDDSPERLKALSVMLSNIEVECNGHVAISALKHSEISKKKLNYKTAESLNVANILKSVKGWDIGISMVENSPKEVKVSLRTRNPDVYDLSKIAALCGGGGHKAASGIFMKTTMKSAKTKLLKAINSLHKESFDIQ